MRNWRIDGPLASTMLSKPVASWLSDRAQISDRRVKRTEEERVDETEFNNRCIITDEC